MKQADNIHKMIKKLQVDPSAEMDRNVHSRITSALEKWEKTKSATTQANIWRSIMKSNKTKCATAAAVILIGVMFGLHFMNGSPDGAGKVYAMSDIPELLKQAKTCHIHGWVQGVYFGQPNLSGEDSPRLELDYWIDTGNRRFRSEKSGDIDKETGEANYFTTVFDGEYLMTETHFRSVHGKKWKEIKYEKLGEFYARLMTHNSFYSLIQQTFGGIHQVEEFNHAGEEEIDGIIYEIWEGEVEEDGEFAKIKGWLSPLTGKIGRLEFQWNRGTMVIDKIELDVALPEDIFLTDPPEGYRLSNTKETAPWKEFGDGYVGLGPLHMVVPISFTLGDGSVIVCWRSLDNTEPDQKVLFEELETGGELPKLPIEIYGLEAKPATLKIGYKGYHLTHTYKNDKFYEWSLYVPEDEAPKRNTIMGYELLRRQNADKEKDASTITYGINQDIMIETNDKFNTWVLGAMAELSDDGFVPEGMSYEFVLELSEQLRLSLEN